MEELTELLHRAYARLGAMGLNYTATDQDAATTARRAARGECWVAVREGRVVGTITFHSPERARGSPWLDRPDVACFHQFGVEPELQGSGIGGRLLDLAERRAAESGAAEIALDTAEPATHLVALYGRRGYRIVEKAQWRGKRYVSVIMSKPVAPPTGAPPR